MIIQQVEATPAELEFIYADFAKIEAQKGIGQGERKRYSLRVSSEDNPMVGYASGLIYCEWFYLTDMWIAEKHRSQKLGSKLLLQLESEIQLFGVKNVYTWTTSNNSKFYESLGYTMFIDLKGYFANPEITHVGYKKVFHV
jgi:ribosomal protein S18 acetylase RimI-like enzyme